MGERQRPLPRAIRDGDPSAATIAMHDHVSMVSDVAQLHPEPAPDAAPDPA